MENFSEELQYTPKVNNHSTIVYRSLTSQASTPTLSLTSAVGPQTFIIPPTVFNPSISRLNFSLNLETTGGAALCNYVNANALNCISRIVCYDITTNSVLADIGNCDYYASLVVPSGTKKDEILSKPSLYVSNVDGTVGMPTIAADTAKNIPYEEVSKYNGTTGNLVLSGGRQLSYYSINGRRQYHRGIANSTSQIYFSIPLNAFKMSFLSTNRMLYNPSNMAIDIYWNASNQFAFKAETDFANAAALGNAPTLSNVSLSLAVESNLSIVSQVIDKVMKEGLSLPIAYPTITRQSINSTSPSYSLVLNRAYGSRVLSLITARFGDGTDELYEANKLHQRGTLTYYQTTLNSVPILYPAGINCSNGEDALLANKPYYEKSAVEGLGEYVYSEWLAVDSWVGQKPIWKMDEDQHQIDGLDVSVAQSTWSFQGTASAAAAYTYITAIIGQKVASFTSMGVQVV